MERLLITLLLAILTTLGFSQNLPIVGFLGKASSIDDKFDTTNSPFVIRRIEVTSNSLTIDGKEMIDPSYQECHFVDSLIDTLLKLKLGIVTRSEKGSDIEYFKVTKVDTILSMRFATIGIPLTNGTNIDSLSLELTKQVRKGTHWNELKYHLAEDAKSIKGISGWVRSTEIIDEFKMAFHRHKIGDIFVVKNNDLKYGWIVYKTDNEKSFERKQILYATNHRF